MEFKNLSVQPASMKHIFEILHVLNLATLNLHQKGNTQWDYPWNKEDIAPDIEAAHAYVVVLNFQTIATFFVEKNSSPTAIEIKAGSVYLDLVAILPEFQSEEMEAYIINYAKELVGIKTADFTMKDYVLNFAKALLAIDSPSGYCMDAICFVKEEVERLGYETTMNAKGNLIIDIPGNSEKTVGLSAHVDTLGLMVRSIKGDGTLTFTPIGGPILPTYDGEYCRIHTRAGNVYTGTVLSNQTSVHVHKEASTAGRNADNMHIRIDERVKSKDDVIKLGIQNGDFVAIETKTQVTESGFIKSRFLDDKISVSCLVGILAHLKENQIPVRHHTKMIISTYEEVGHGSSQIPTEIKELIAVDMGCIGEDLACTEYDVSICAKDSSGPYDYALTSKLINLAKDEKLNYVVDIYPMYGSDVSAALRGGNDICGALIGPGVAASHGMERTHWDGVESTIKLLLAYLGSE